MRRSRKGLRHHLLLWSALTALGLQAASAGSLAARAVRSGQTPLVPDIATAIRTILAEGGGAAFGPITTAEGRQLTALYSTGAEAPLWVDASGRVTRHAVDALTVLGGAAGDGLDPTAYDVGALEGLASAVGAVSSPWAAAAFDTALSASLLRFFRHLNRGRVDPGTHGFKTAARADDPDLVSLLRSALLNGRIRDAAAGVAPRLALYRRLRTVLARYRLLAADPALGDWPALGETVHPGEPYAGAEALRRRLVAFGDMSPDTPALLDAPTFDDFLVDGVRSFQRRHGLPPDGVLGAQTHAALSVPLAWRVRQIELSLERLRWLPAVPAGRFIMVNIPMFHLWAWDADRDGVPSFETRVIVGRARRTQTPMLVAGMRDVLFRPYWNVPRSILRGEILPVLERDPAYLETHNMEIVSGESDAAAVVAPSDDSMAQLRAGRLRIRQRPGPKNSLGLVKFVFPNDYDVYLHGTPAMALFSLPRRDFSHGCMRTQDPVGLAEWVLEEEPVWNRDRILGAMNADKSQRVNLHRPVAVVVFYLTAAVIPDDDTIFFAGDIYGHDASLDRALGRLRFVS